MDEPTSYLGSKISLISRSQIRYEGILYTINREAFTVALSKVRSFGTEDRLTDKPVPPRDEVYEYIIFRSSDIKDLEILEPPAQFSSSLPNDPAIVQHSNVARAPGQMSDRQFNKQPMPNAYSSYSNVVRSGPEPPFPSGGHSAQPPSIHSDSRSGTPTSRKTPTIDASVQATYDSQKEGQQRRGGGRGGGNVHGNRPQMSQNDRSNDDRQHQQRRQGQGQGQGQAPQRQRRGGRGGPRRGRGQRGRGGQPLKFDQDFDFETANAEFLELENQLASTSISEPVVNGDEKVPEEVPKEPQVEAPGSSASSATGPIEGATALETVVDENNELIANPFYNKKKSFFDNISCETLEQSKGNRQRPDRKHERKINTETFGVSGTYRRGWHGGRGYRGYRGYRGGRGFYRQSTGNVPRRTTAAS